MYYFGGQTLTPPEVGSTVLFPEGLGTTTTTGAAHDHHRALRHHGAVDRHHGPVHADHGACADDGSAAHHRPALVEVPATTPTATRPAHGPG